MPSRPQAPPAVTYQPLPARRGALARYAGALAVLAILVAAIWLLATNLVEQVRDRTPEELRAQMADPASGLGVEEAIEQVNRMTADQRRRVMQSDEARRFVQRLEPKQRLQFVEKTLDRGIQVQLERYRKMSAEEKKAFVEQVQEEAKERRKEMDDLPPEEKERLKNMISGGEMQEMIEKAVKAYLSLTTSEERAELAPLFESALDNLEYARNLP